MSDKSGSKPKKKHKKKGKAPKPFRPVLKFRDLNSHTVEVDFGLKSNRKPDPAEPYSFDGGPVGPAELGISLDAGNFHSDFANLEYHPEDNVDVEFPKPKSGKKGKKPKKDKGAVVDSGAVGSANEA